MGGLEQQWLRGHAASVDGFLEALGDGPDATVPAYPGWSVRDLAVHMTEVHTMASLVLETGAAERPQVTVTLKASDGVSVLQEAVADAARRLRVAHRDCRSARLWTTTGMTGSRAFWVRRMRIEAALHCWDAGQATGRAPMLDPDCGLEGIDEFLQVHLPRGLTGREHPIVGSVVVRADGRATPWTIDLATGRATRHASSGVGAVVSGRPGSLWLWLNLRSGLPSPVTLEDADGSGHQLVGALRELRVPPRPGTA